MDRITKMFKELRKENKKAFIAYICAGDPNLHVTYRLAIALQEAGVDLIELGIPFSDPLADGPTIQAASQRALIKGANLSKIFNLVERLRKGIEIPIVFMSYYNPIYQFGLRDFVIRAKKTGLDGVIIPDLPPEEAGDFMRFADKKDFCTIFLLAPTSTKERIKLIASRSRGFIYYVSVTGVTGARESLPEDIKDNLSLVRKITKKPVCIGFGVSKPSQIKDIARFSDGIIVGSAIIKRIEKNLNKKDLVEKVKRFVKTLTEATHNE